MKKFYPSKRICDSRYPIWSPFEYLIFYQSVPGRVLEKLISAPETEMQKCVFCGWVGRWVDGDFNSLDFPYFQV